jgi:hypothetical protein
MKMQPREKRRAEQNVPAVQRCEKMPCQMVRDLILRRLAGSAGPASPARDPDLPAGSLAMRLHRRDPLSQGLRRGDSFSILERIRRFEERRKAH